MSGARSTEAPGFSSALLTGPDHTCSKGIKLAIRINAAVRNLVPVLKQSISPKPFQAKWIPVRVKKTLLTLRTIFIIALGAQLV